MGQEGRNGIWRIGREKGQCRVRWLCTPDPAKQSVNKVKPSDGNQKEDKAGWKF
jgi:hypothetical protein